MFPENVIWSMQISRLISNVNYSTRNEHSVNAFKHTYIQRPFMC